MKHLVALTGALLGCSPVMAPMNTLHPTASGNANSAGVSVGGLYGKPAEAQQDIDGSLIMFPFGEGFVRFAAGPGELEARISPLMGSVAYRLNLTASGQGAGVALIPGLGVSYFRIKESDESTRQTVIAPSLVALFLLGDGKFYIAPRYSYVSVGSKTESEFGSESTSSAITVLGGYVGFIAQSDPFKLTLELSFQRLTTDEPGSDGAIYVFLPTLGIHL